MWKLSPNETSRTSADTPERAASGPNVNDRTNDRVDDRVREGTGSGLADRTGPRVREMAALGPSFVLKGELDAEESLLLEGSVEGRVTLSSGTLTIGPKGRVKADVRASTVKVEGLVEGELRGDERVVIRSSGRVFGNVVSPRVTLEDGCRFKGYIDMDANVPARPVLQRDPRPAPDADDEDRAAIGVGDEASSDAPSARRDAGDKAQGASTGKSAAPAKPTGSSKKGGYKLQM